MLIGAVVGSGRIRSACADDASEIAAVHVASWRDTYTNGGSGDPCSSVTVSGRIPVWASRIRDPAPGENLLVSEELPGGEELPRDEADRGLTGFVWLGPTTDEDDDPASVGQIRSIHVHPRCHGRGWGRRLLAAAQERLISAGRRQVSLWVVTDNHRARGFYERLGWQFDAAHRKEILAVGDEQGPTVEVVRYRLPLGRHGLH